LSTSNFQTLFMTYIYPIDDGREVEKHQNGTGIGNEGDPAYTLDRQQQPAVAIGFSHNQGLDVQPTEEGTPTLRANGAGMAVAQAFDSYNHSLSDTNQTLRKGAGGIDHTGSILENSTVRRLTPTECERLQGFPDGWTDGQADSHRYKQMGNAVAVPVVQWIINRL
jgi:site-specific DNA-cytosine methylase